MEEILTNCLINIRNDLGDLKKMREYLDSNSASQTQGGCMVTWRTIEAYNSILAACTSGDIPEIESLNTLLDSLNFIVNNNNDEKIWTNFGFELGVICIKMLSAIEKTQMFGSLFCKLLTIINVICERNTDTWKAVARQILNVFINKKFSFVYFESGLKLYISILRKIEGFILYSFAQQNLHLLKALSNSVLHLGDFEAQADLMELVFLHISGDKALIDDFFKEQNPSIVNLFQNLKFVDFERDCRIYLNALNKSLGPERKVFSVCFSRFSVGHCSLKPPTGRKSIWLDANETTQRLSIRCGDFESNSPKECIIYIQFADVTFFMMEQQLENRHQIFIKSNNLKKIDKSVKSDEMTGITSPTNNAAEDVAEFKKFLEKALSRVRENVEKLSQTRDHIIIDRNLLAKKEFKIKTSGSALNAGSGIRRIIPNALSLLDRVETKAKKPKYEERLMGTEQEDGETRKELSGIRLRETTSPSNFQNPGKFEIQESQELTSSSFIESLNKNLGLDESIMKNSFEDSLEPLAFPATHAEVEKEAHFLFKSSNVNFSIPGEQHPSDSALTADKDLCMKALPSRKSTRKRKEPLENDITTKICPEANDSPFEKHFRESSYKKKLKPKLPKLRKSKRQLKKSETVLEKDNVQPTEKKSVKKEDRQQRPSLLDPNGYAYQRWLKPTTSERSNYWLNKLHDLEKTKKNAAGVFEFEEDSDTDMEIFRKGRGHGTSMKSRKKNEVKKRGTKTKASEPKKQTNKKEEINKRENPLKMMDNKLKITSDKQENSGILVEKSNLKEGDTTERVHDDAEDPIKETDKMKSIINETFDEDEQANIDSSKFWINMSDLSFGKALSKTENEAIPCGSDICEEWDQRENEARDFRSETGEENENNFLGFTDDDLSLSEIEDDHRESVNFSKRELWDEEDTVAEDRPLKKSKSGGIESVLRVRMQKFHEKYRRETDEIVQTISDATERFMYQIHKQHEKDVTAFVQKAEEVTSVLCEQNFADKFHRIQKVYLYYKSKCSVQDTCDSIKARITEILKALNELTLNKNSLLEKMQIFKERLNNVIETQIENMIDRDVCEFRNRILQSASLFNIGCPL